jgi:type IVB pilus formation R64 PilN family outer membrane protein
MPSAVTFSEQSWVPLRKIEVVESDTTQAKTNSIQVVFNQKFINLNEIAREVSSVTGMAAYVSTDVSSATGQTQTSAPTSALAPPVPPFVPPAQGMQGRQIIPSLASPLPISSMPNMNNATGAQIGAITVQSPFTANYSGNLTGFLNMVAGYYGISWKNDEAGIRFYLLETKTFQISSLPGDTRLTSSVESSASTSGSGSQSSANSTGVSYASLSVWSSLETVIKQMLGPLGKVNAAPALGTLTVTDTVSTVRRIAEFVKIQNIALNRQVSLNVRVLSVEISDADNYGINWDSVYATLSAASNPFQLAVKTAFPVASSAGNFVISAPTSSTSRWAGSSAIVNALSTQGRVSELTSATVVTLNNQAAPLNVGRKTSYLASSTTSLATNVVTTTLTPGVVQTGFSMTVVPHILDGQDMLLQYSLDISSLLNLQVETSGGSTIRTPDIATSNFIQRVKIKSGETLVVSGFDQDNLSAVSNGIGSANNALLGSRVGNGKRRMLVILIQPTLAL